MSVRIEYHKITEELLKILKTHITVGSFRRNCSMAKQIIEQIEEPECPRLFYALIDGNWEVHAIELDLLRYLLKIDSITPHPIDPDDPDDDFFIKSKMWWDGVTGKTDDGPWSTPVIEDAGKFGIHAIFDGEIKFYNEGEVTPYSGNYLGLYIKADVEMLAYYPNATITFWNSHETRNLMESSCSGLVRWCPLISVPGQESRVTIEWKPGLTESFIVMVTQNSIIQDGGEVTDPNKHDDKCTIPFIGN